MTSEQEEVDTSVNRKNRIAVERAMVWSIIASIIVSVILLYLDRAHNIFTSNFLNIFGIYPERLLLGTMPDTIKIILFVSNIFTLLYFIIHVSIMRPEIIQNDYERQDRRTLLWILCAFFYGQRFWLLYLFSSDGKSIMIVLIPSLTIVSVSTALLSLSTVGGDRRT